MPRWRWSYQCPKCLGWSPGTYCIKDKLEYDLNVCRKEWVLDPDIFGRYDTEGKD